MRRDYRYRVLELSKQALLDLFKQDEIHWKVTEGKLPKDTRIVGSEYDARRGCLMMVIESKEFDKVPEGGIAPFMPLPKHNIVIEGKLN